jgi:3-hydroxybutyryl-CoA dehydratase
MTAGEDDLHDAGMSPVFGLPPSFANIEVGQKFEGRLTVTEAHVVLASGIFADFAPLHVDETFARQTRYGTRIAHGTLVIGIMAGVLSKALGPSALGLLDHRAQFLAPVVPGDTISTVWEVREKIETPRLEGGIVRLVGSSRTQKDTVVVTAECSLLVDYGEHVSSGD